MASPFGAPASTPLWPRLLQACEAVAANWTAASRYNDFMDAATGVVLELGLLDAVVPACRFSGIPYWTKRACMKFPRCSKVYDVKSVLAAAWGANVYWQFAKGEGAKKTNANGRGSSTNIAKGSDWDILNKHAEALGKSFEDTLNIQSPSCKKQKVLSERESSTLSTLS